MVTNDFFERIFGALLMTKTYVVPAPFFFNPNIPFPLKDRQ